MIAKKRVEIVIVRPNSDNGEVPSCSLHVVNQFPHFFERARSRAIDFIYVAFCFFHCAELFGEVDFCGDGFLPFLLLSDLTRTIWFVVPFF